MHSDPFIQIFTFKQQLGICAAWLATGFLSKAFFNQVRMVWRISRKPKVDPALQLHEEYQRFRGDLANPLRPYPANRFRNSGSPETANTPQPLNHTTI